jgi:hypothetical protein
MSSPERQIIEAVQRMTDTKLDDKVKLFVGSVDSVDLSTRTCTVSTVSSKERIAIQNVLLMAALDDGFLLVPAVNSTVLVMYSTYNKPYVAMYSELQEIVLVVGSSILDVTDGLFSFNKGVNGGLAIVPALVTKLNNLELLLNDLIAKYNVHFHTGVTTGVGVSGTTAAVETTTLTPTVRGDIENTKIKH